MDRTTKEWLELRPELEHLASQGHSLSYIAKQYDVPLRIMAQVFTALNIETFRQKLIREMGAVK